MWNIVVTKELLSTKGNNGCLLQLLMKYEDRKITKEDGVISMSRFALATYTCERYAEYVRKACVRKMPVYVGGYELKSPINCT